MSKKNDLDIEDGESSGDGEAFRIHTRVVSREHDVYLPDEVQGESHKYIDLQKFLREVSPSDTVNLFITNAGGSCIVGFDLAHTVKNCSATVIVHLKSRSSSMGAILCLAGDYLVMYPGSCLMFHNYSAIEAGKGGELVDAVHSWGRQSKTLLSYFCEPFLTKEEIKSLINDQDVYIHADHKDLKKRLKRHFKDVKVTKQ